MALQMMKPSAGLKAPQLPARHTSTRVCAAAVKQETAQASGAASSKAEDIYIGFPKNDYAPRAGRKGRVIKDDPKKYPGREDLGFFLGAVGGWAGGEAGLWQLRDEIKAEQAKSSSSNKQATPLAPSSPIRQPAKNKWGVRQPTSTKDEIYVGFGKDELELKKSGAQGRVIYDDAYKYPGKEDVGPFLGAVGGFAGGEAALKQFAETGELKLRKPGDPLVKKQFSPLTLAFLIIFAAAGGGILLTTAFDLSDAGIQEVVQAPIDDTTKNLLLAAIILISTATLIGSGLAVVTAIKQRIADSAEEAYEVAQRIAITSIFFVAVFFVASAILESP